MKAVWDLFGKDQPGNLRHTMVVSKRGRGRPNESSSRNHLEPPANSLHRCGHCMGRASPYLRKPLRLAIVNASVAEQQALIKHLEKLRIP